MSYHSDRLAESGTVLVYQCEEASGTLDNAEGTSARDGTSVGGVTYQAAGAYHTGTYGITVNGSTGYVHNDAVHAQFDGITKATLKGWIKRSATNKIVAFGFNDVYPQRFDIELYSDGNLYFQAEKGAQGTGTVAFTGSVDTWYHVALCYDGTATGNANRLRGYINGVQQTLDFGAGTIDSTLYSALGPFNVGRSLLTTYSTGSYDEVQLIAGVAQTTGQILADYNAGVGVKPVLVTTSPYFTASDGTTFTLVFDRQVLPASTINGFTVKDTTTTNAVTGTWTQPGSTSQYLFTFDSALPEGHNASVEYASGGGNVTDVFSQPMDTFAAVPVYNARPYTGATLTAFGITLSFNKAITSSATAGTSTGRWGVLYAAGLALVSVSPAPTGSGSSSRNAVVVNFDPTAVSNFSPNPFDGRALNFDTSQRKTVPRLVSAGDNIIVAESFGSGTIDLTDTANDPGGSIYPSAYRRRSSLGADSPNDDSVIKSAVIVHVLSSLPGSAFFGPSYIGGSTQTVWLVSDLIATSSLPNNTVPASLAALTTDLTRAWLRPFIGLGIDYEWGGFAATQQQPTYGTQAAALFGQTLEMLAYNIGTSPKQALLYPLVQHFIDMHGLVEIVPTAYSTNGTWDHGRHIGMATVSRYLGASWDLSGVTFQERDSVYDDGTANLATGYSTSKVKRGEYGHYEDVARSGWAAITFAGGYHPYEKAEPYGRQMCKDLVSSFNAMCLLGMRPYLGTPGVAYREMLTRWMTESDQRAALAAAGVANSWGSPYETASTYNPAEGSVTTTFESDAYTLIAADTTSPTASVASLGSSGTILTVVFSEAVMPPSSITGLTITASGGAVTLSATAISGSTYTATTSRTIGSSETMTLAAASSNITDMVGLPLADFSGFAVANNAGGATAYTLSGSLTAQVGVPITLTVTPNADGTWTFYPVQSPPLSGTFSVVSLSWSGTHEAKTFTFTPLVAGTITISGVNFDGLANPADVVLTVGSTRIHRRVVRLPMRRRAMR